MKLHVVACVIIFSCGLVLCDELTHVYDSGDDVIVYANKIGPFNNPLETYAYFEMPGCPPYSWDHKYPSLGQALAGDELYRVKAPIQFKKNSTKQSVCPFTPTDADVQKWIRMIDEQYWYQLYSDDLPMWATLGSIQKDSVAPGKEAMRSIFTHQQFVFGYNGNRIVSVNLTASAPIPLTLNMPGIYFTYAVTFHESTVPFEKRFDLYLDDKFFEHKIHWFSIFNAFMVVLFLIGAVAAVLTRTLSSDYAKHAQLKQSREMGDAEEDWIEDAGWKQLTHDVFRVPSQAVLLCALLGTGWQLTILVLLVIILAIAATVYTSPGSLATYAVLAFAATSYIAGFFSASQFSHYALVGPTISTQWIRCMALTASLFPLTVLTSGFLLNFVAIAYDSAQAIPFGGMVVMFLLWACIVVPLVVMGTVVGRHSRSVSSAQKNLDIPRVNQIPRMIPRRPWFLSRIFVVTVSGILPFGCIFIEVYFVFTSFWNYKLYYVYGFMILVFSLLVIVTACLSIVVAYIILNKEDHRWQWMSFGVGASVAGYVFLYAVYFYKYKTRMSGFFMFSFYFTYSTLMCVALGIIGGSVAFAAASMFVTKIYRNVKLD